jgi:hypothetical protein
MPIVAGKGPLIPQASIVSSSPSASLPSSSPLMSMGKGIANIHHPLFQNNSSGMFMGLTSPLMSISAALESSSSRHSSPPPQPLRQSPPHGQVNGGSHNGGNLSSNGQRMLELVDELCYLYPSEDFSLLRRAMMKNEVSFTKLSPPIRRHNNRKNSSPVPNDYITQQTLQMIKNQNEYLQLLQSGYANFSNFQDTADPNNGKYASWLSNPFAAAAAAGFNVPGLNKHGNGAENNRKKGHNNNNDTPQNQYNFALPKAPLSNSKSKTVAAVLAATRNGSSAPRMQNQNSQQNAYNNPKPKRPSQRRKMTNGRPPKQMCSPNNDDDFLDPMSMLEVVTSRPSPIENNYHNTSDSLGMDLSTGSVIQRSPAYPSSSSTIRSKAMNKDYGFLSELGLVRKAEEESMNGHTSPPDSSTASLEHFVDSVLHQRRSSPQTSSSSSPVDPNPVNESKDLVLEAFNYDPEMAGDPRAVARKFGLNIRVVQKWIREAPTRSIPLLLTNGNGHNEDHDDEEDYNENLLQKSVIASTSSLNTNNGPTINKRKNPKPNQICDFTTEEDLDENGALDMVVPIKKRRLSTPTPTSA